MTNDDRTRLTCSQEKPVCQWTEANVARVIKDLDNLGKKETQTRPLHRLEEGLWSLIESFSDCEQHTKLARIKGGRLQSEELEAIKRTWVNIQTQYLRVRDRSGRIPLSGRCRELREKLTEVYQALEHAIAYESLFLIPQKAYEFRIALSEFQSAISTELDSYL